MSEYTEGICGDGAVILKDGQPMTISEILAALQDSKPAAESRETVPNGYALTPVDPTPAMLDVAVSYALNVSVIDEGGWSKYMAAVYRRMLDAAPRPAEEDV